VIDAPPLNAGAENVTDTCVSPAVAVPMAGAPGVEALTVNDWLAWLAALKLLLPAWSALIVQVPAVTNVSVPPDVTVQTPVVEDVNTGGRPDVAVAVSVGVVPKFCAPGLLKVIVWLPLGVAELEAAEAELVPIAFVAVTEKV
jgi:hypothetical protein